MWVHEKHAQEYPSQSIQVDIFPMPRVRKEDIVGEVFRICKTIMLLSRTSTDRLQFSSLVGIGLQDVAIACAIVEKTEKIGGLNLVGTGTIIFNYDEERIFSSSANRITICS